MSIQFKTIRELREMLDKKVISSEELTNETLKLAENLKNLNCCYGNFLRCCHIYLGRPRAGRTNSAGEELFGFER